MIIQSTFRRVRRLALRNRVSYPYLSGDAFKGICEAHVTTSRRLSPERLRNIVQARSIFIKGDLALEFLDNYSRYLSPDTVVIGNSDEDFLDDFSRFGWKSTKGPTHFLVQNFCSDTSDKRYCVLPIGIENLSLGNNGIVTGLRPVSSSEKDKNVLVGPFAHTHEVRQRISDSFIKDDFFSTIQARLNRRKYRELLRRHRFVLCPRGNGMDTHRFWESLYAGSIPIVEESNWSQRLKALKIPFVIVPEFDPEVVREHVRNFPLQSIIPKDYPQLWIDYWKTQYFPESKSGVTAKTRKH